MPDVATHADALRLKVGSTEVEHFAAAGTIPGVAIAAAGGRNGPGVGRLRNNGTQLYWQAPGSDTYGPPVDCPADGTYLLEDGEDADRWLRVTVYADYLLGFAEAQVYLADLFGGDVADEDVTGTQAAAGDANTYTITIENASTFTLSQIKFWLDPLTADLEISDDGAAWVSPTTEAGALAFPDLAPGDTDTLHLKRTITAGAAPDADVLNHLHFTFCGI